MHKMSSHRLAIELGRWVRPTRIPIDERKCSLCQVLEDEYHFVLECNVYAELRYKYIPKYYWKRPSMYKFVELLNTTNMKILRNLSIYIYISCFSMSHRTAVFESNLTISIHASEKRFCSTFNDSNIHTLYTFLFQVYIHLLF